MGSSGLGQSIRTLRLQQQMTGTELAQRCRVTKGLISQIERGITVPSLEVLARIADALNVTVGQLMDTYGARRSREISDVSQLSHSPLVRRNHRKRVSLPEVNQLCEFLTPSLEGEIGFLILTVGALDAERIQSYQHRGEECLLVLEGNLTVYLGEVAHFLAQGDSMSYPASIPHRYVCQKGETAVILLAEAPPAFLSLLGQHLSATSSTKE